MKLVLYVFMCYFVSCLCVVLVLLLVVYLIINNWVIVFDLDGDIDDLLVLLVEVIVQCLYMWVSELFEGVVCVLLKEVYLNKVLVLIVWNYLCVDDYVCFGLDVVVIEVKVEWLCVFVLQLVEKVCQVYNQFCVVIVVDVDVLLYDGFFGNGDKLLFVLVCMIVLEQLVVLEGCFCDLCLFELLFCYCVCNYFGSFVLVEYQCWQDYCCQCLFGDGGLGEFNLFQYQ